MSLTAWALLTMSHAAMRLAAPGFIFGLAAATFVLDPPGDPSSSVVDGEALVEAAARQAPVRQVAGDELGRPSTGSRRFERLS